MAIAQSVARLPVFYGWVVVGCMFLLLWTAHGLTLAGIPVFDELILEELGISRGTLKFRDFITVMCAGLSGPLVGYFADRYGARPVIFAGLLFLSAALFLYSTISNTFPPHALGRLMGLFVIIEAVGAGSGSWLTGVLFDSQGSYDLAFLLTVGFMVVAIVGTRFLRARSP